MAALQASSFLLSSSSSSSSSASCSSKRIYATIHVPNPKLRRVSNFSIPKLPRNLVEEFNLRDGFTTTITKRFDDSPKPASDMATTKLYAIMEAIADRVEMHVNVGEQRENWNALLLNSINTITLAATTMAGLAAMGGGGVGTSLLAFKLSSTLLFSAATGMLLVKNKIQPSQLAEEQRNASRLFKQLQKQIQTIIALRTPTQKDVNDMMEKVLALDRAYPLPLLGVMLEKFPATFEPAVWWPRKLGGGKRINGKKMGRVNGWSEEMELEMREIVEVLRGKDKEDYVRLGSLALKINKVLAISGPIVSGIAAIGSAFVGSSSHGSLAMTMAVVGGALATIVNTLEHGGQVGMVLEMYRNCAGFFSFMEESIESTLEEGEVENRENGELFQLKVALKLGRSLSQLRNLAKMSASSRRDGNAIDEFGSKLF